MGKFQLVVVWLAATLVATLLTFAAVSFVAGDFDTGPRVQEAALLPSTTPTIAPAVTSTTSIPRSEADTSSTLPEPTDTTPTTSEPASNSSTTTTSTTVPSGGTSSSTTSTTTPGATTTDTEVIVTEGGTVAVSCLGTTAKVEWATPTGSYQYDPEKTSGDEIEVDFEWEDVRRIRVKAHCEGGDVVHTVKIEDESD